MTDSNQHLSLNLVLFEIAITFLIVIFFGLLNLFTKATKLLDRGSENYESDLDLFYNHFDLDLEYYGFRFRDDQRSGNNDNNSLVGNDYRIGRPGYRNGRRSAMRG